MGLDLAAAVHENYLWALERVTALGPGGDVARAGPWLLLDAGQEFDYFNVAAVAGPVAAPSAATALADAWFEERGRAFRFVLRDIADASVIRYCIGAGLADEEREPAMVADLPLTPARAVGGVEIRRVARPGDVRLYASVEPSDAGSSLVRETISRRALTVEGCALFLGLDEGVAVARSMALRSGPVVGIYNVYVAESHRRRGIGAAITAAAIEAGREGGATVACLSATEAGLSLYQRMGFHTLFRYRDLWRPVDG